ncbi:hypothetical protein B0O80DRAFT_500226 [Mortierella sp. GBAus27b]|nr:hypothetical protein B0O80DRAFT_500226 [Mortierella sp. GBAus27b]
MERSSMVEFKAALRSTPRMKALGASGTTNELFLGRGEIGDYVLFQLLCAYLVQEDVALEWKTGIVYCIPKAVEWYRILQGPNFSVLKGTITKDPIHILQGSLEDARDYKKELWGYIMEGPGQPISISGLAFVDDTTWIARSRENMQDILDIATSFFTLNAIEIDAKKTVVGA